MVNNLNEATMGPYWEIHVRSCRLNGIVEGSLKGILIFSPLDKCVKARLPVGGIWLRKVPFEAIYPIDSMMDFDGTTELRRNLCWRLGCASGETLNSAFKRQLTGQQQIQLSLLRR